MIPVRLCLVTKTRIPAVEGLFTEVDGVARLIGAKVPDRESYFFPAHLAGMAGGDPAAVGAELGLEHLREDLGDALLLEDLGAVLLIEQRERGRDVKARAQHGVRAARAAPSPA